MLEMLPVYDGESYENFIYLISARVRIFSAWAMKVYRDRNVGESISGICEIGLCGSFTVRTSLEVHSC